MCTGAAVDKKTGLSSILDLVARWNPLSRQKTLLEIFYRFPYVPPIAPVYPYVIILLLLSYYTAQILTVEINNTNNHWRRLCGPIDLDASRDDFMTMYLGQRTDIIVCVHLLNLFQGGLLKCQNATYSVVNVSHNTYTRFIPYSGYR